MKVITVLHLSCLEDNYLIRVSPLPYSTLQRLLDSSTMRMGGDVLDRPHVLRGPVQTMSNNSLIHALCKISPQWSRWESKGETFQVNLNPLVFCPSTAMQSRYLLFNQQWILDLRNTSTWPRKEGSDVRGTCYCYIFKLRFHSVSYSKDVE